MSLSFLHDELKETKTHKKVFLARIERIMPWGELEALVKPYYFEGKHGNKPYDLELMLRIHLLQNLYDLSDNLTDRGLILKKGTIVDSTIISAPSFTKNQEKQRDPDAHSVRKGTAWYFSYRAHVGVDRDTGLVHHVEVTAANVSDVTMTAALLTGDEEEAYGDSGDIGVEKRPAAMTRNRQGKAIAYRQNRKPSQIR